MTDFGIVEMELREAASQLPPDTGLEFRPFFGGLGGWARGHFFMFATRHEDVYLKLTAEDQADLLAAAGIDVGEHHELGHQYLHVPPGVMSEPPALREWVERSIGYAISLPPKRKKRR